MQADLIQSVCLFAKTKFKNDLLVSNTQNPTVMKWLEHIRLVVLQDMSLQLGTQGSKILKRITGKGKQWFKLATNDDNVSTSQNADRQYFVFRK